MKQTCAVLTRRRLKARAVAYMGDACSGCGRAGHQAIFEFHHRKPSEKEFGITSDGIPRRWGRILAELAKCVMLCANCHREVHAGARELDEGLLGLAEAAGVYVTTKAA
jgi:predicted HNH restriction endonuclease